MKYIIKKSTRKEKKLMVIIYDNNKKVKTIHFGAIGHGDYPFYYKTKGKQYAQYKKGQYIARHRVREDWTDKLKAGFWARYILWNKPTIKQSIEDLRKVKRMNILYNK